MTGQSAALDQALAFAAQGWPVFPCLPGRKIPATTHGYLDATTDQAQITAWFTRHPGANLAVVTGAPGPDVLDVDQHGPAGDGFAALSRLHRAGLLEGATACVRTPSGGLHLYFTGSTQRNGHLPAHHLDFRSTGGYVLAPPSQIGGKPYRLAKTRDGRGGRGGLDWAAVTRLLEPHRQPQQPASRQPTDGGNVERLASWVAHQGEGNRNAGLFWAASRALEADHAADLTPLAAAARQAGLGEREIQRTLDSARKAGHTRPAPHDQQAEAVT